MTPLIDMLRRLSAGYGLAVEPASDGLPRWRVLLFFPAIVIVALITVTALGVNGSSSGYLYSSVFEGDDPALIAGEPRAIRSDEWNVGAVWTISQIEQGLPEVNAAQPGGVDAAIPQDLPRADWSVAFRPHLAGFLALPVDQAAAWKWWIPPASVLILASIFMVTVLPRRPVLGALASIGFISAPFFQWWFQSVTFWPVAWGLAVMIALVWATRARARLARWGWAALAGYLTVVMAMGLYVPYIVPVVIVVAFFGSGVYLGAIRKGGWGRPALRIVPILVAGTIGAVVTVLWLRSKQDVIDAFLSTSYPGERLFATGSGGALTLARTVSSSFAEALSRANGFLGTNSSEASMFFLFGVFLVPGLIWLVVRTARRREMLPWEAIGLLGGLTFLVAFIFVPGWDALAHLLFLDRSTDTRVRIGLGLVSFALLPLLISTLEKAGRPAPLGLTIVVTALFALSQVAIAVAYAIQAGADELWRAAPFWWLFAGLSAAAIALVLRRYALAGTAAFALVGILGAIGVNPIYIGLLDLRDSEAAELVERIDAQQPGSWVAIGSTVPTALLVETGVTSYNGIQGAPSEQFWSVIDPDDEYRFEWNRLGNISWTPGTGDPVVVNPAPDQISVSFDACSAFAQGNVAYVLSDNDAFESSCVEELRSVELPSMTLTAYRVVTP